MGITMKDDIKAVSVGMYDTLYQCNHCNFRFCISMDTSDEENETRMKHNCAEHQPTDDSHASTSNGSHH